MQTDQPIKNVTVVRTPRSVVYSFRRSFTDALSVLFMPLNFYSIVLLLTIWGIKIFDLTGYSKYGYRVEGTDTSDLFMTILFIIITLLLISTHRILEYTRLTFRRFEIHFDIKNRLIKNEYGRILKLENNPAYQIMENFQINTQDHFLLAKLFSLRAVNQDYIIVFTDETIPSKDKLYKKQIQLLHWFPGRNKSTCESIKLVVNDLKEIFGLREKELK